ncbi:hypothetical protein TruAng_003455 [Truncatella angustata]|nr:hypothetical protein TruAng_003455 [Truncatella angustata]
MEFNGALCGICHKFTSDLFGFNFAEPPSLPLPWVPQDQQSRFGWGVGFRHHETLDDLLKSSQECEMCEVLYEDLAIGLDRELCRGWLGLYPWWSNRYIASGSKKGQFRAGFRNSLQDMPWGATQIGASPSHTFKVCRREIVPNSVIESHELVVYEQALVTPTYISSGDIARKVERWTQNCAENHQACQKETGGTGLPTRVIDIGGPETSGHRLYESQGEKVPYIALSHCWGGAIPSRTIESNVAERCEAINIEELPKNFRDAIEVARALQIRYIWIDALCIIQDSTEDWFREAAKMASIYAGAAVVVSALDAASSTTGFLGKKRAPLAALNSQYCIQKVFPVFFDNFANRALNTRGWCMQERLLAPTVLHFGKEQMYWECATCCTYEDETAFHPRLSGNAVGIFQEARHRLLTRSEYAWRDWYLLLEEYTMRHLTVASDKLPALAGAASMFQSRIPGATYLGGLWKEDLARGLLWGAHYNHVEGRKVWGYSSADECSALSEAQHKRAPSWSWAALDGRLDFWALRSNSLADFEIIEIEVAGNRENGLTQVNFEGTLKIRGSIAQMFYRPNEGLDVGHLTFAELDSIEDKSTCLGGCVLDVNRQTARACWALIGIREDRTWYLLILERSGAGKYKRIGFCTAYYVEVDPARFAVEEILMP